MTEQARYRIEEQSTAGWVVYDEDCSGLTRNSASERLDNLINREGINPQRLRVVRES